MHNTVIAEWTLTRFTGKQQAAAIIGDLEEASAHKGDAWFWRSYLRILFACAWRPAFGYFVILLTGDRLGSAVNAVLRQSARAHHASGLQQLWLGGVLGLCTSMLAPLALYALVRFGPRDGMTRLIFLFALLGTGIMAFWWQPFVVLALCLAATGLVVSHAFSSKGRRNMASLAIVALLQPLIFFLAFILLVLCTRLSVHAPFIHQDAWDHIVNPMLALFTCCMVGSIHRRLQPREERQLA